MTTIKTADFSPAHKAARAAILAQRRRKATGRKVAPRLRRGLSERDRLRAYNVQALAILHLYEAGDG